MSETNNELQSEIRNLRILQEIKRVVTNCAMKRELLLMDALSRTKIKKRLTVLSGLLALFSAGAITTVIVKFFGNESLQILAAISAAISGFISLVASVYYVEEETAKIFAGSSKYLALRDKAYKIMIQPNGSNEQIFKELETLLAEYAQLDESYAKYAKVKLMEATDPFGQLRGLNKSRRKSLIESVNNEISNFDNQAGTFRKNN